MHVCASINIQNCLVCIVFGMRNLRFADVRTYVRMHLANCKQRARTTAMELTRQSRLSLPKVHGQRHRGDGHRSGSHHRRHLSPLSSLSCTLRLPWRTPPRHHRVQAATARSGRLSAVIGSRRSSKSSSCARGICPRGVSTARQCA